ncbi:MAG TPA: hypothetical protein VGO93_13155 [Candidatus Xenobia bacterium]
MSLKQKLDKGGQVRMAVTADHLHPEARKGDLAVVQRHTLKDLKPGDAVLCLHGGEPALFKVRQAWVMSGLTCLQVNGPDGIARSIPERQLLGKVVEVLPGKAALQVAVPTVLRLVQAVMSLVS